MKGKWRNIGERPTAGRTLPIPHIPAPFVDPLNEVHPIWRSFGVAEVCSSSRMKKVTDSASAVSVLEAWTDHPLSSSRIRGYLEHIPF
jgi:hypothetical protein